MAPSAMRGNDWQRVYRGDQLRPRHMRVVPAHIVNRVPQNLILDVRMHAVDD
jgi:hypothetical protein